jgi:hypothetical protein
MLELLDGSISMHWRTAYRLATYNHITYASIMMLKENSYGQERSKIDHSKVQ